MPELPEVETVVRYLRPRLQGRMLQTVRVSRHRLRQPWRRAWNPAVAGRRIVQLDRRGKWILAKLEPAGTLILHLGMTGRLDVVRADRPMLPHTHVSFGLDTGTEELRFHDPRRFGSIVYSPCDPEAALGEVTDPLGPEPWDLTAQTFHEACRATRRAIKAVLLDQTVLAGVGNIYADESLFEARLHPARCARDLTQAEAARLQRAVVRVLDRAIAQHGSTILTFHYGDGGRGGYQNEFQVYQRTGEPCRRCGAPVVAIRLAGRTTHFCPHCQPATC